MRSDKFVYIPNGICVDEWKADHEIPIEISDLIVGLRKQKKIIIGYAGNHGIANALDVLVDAMKILEQENVVLLLIGRGQEKQNLLNRVQEQGINNVYFISAVPKTIIPSLLDKLDILYIGLQNQPVFRFGISPNKLIDYMMAGKPIIQAIKAGNDMVVEAGCGISIEPENTEAIVKGVRNLIMHYSESLEAMGNRGKEYCIKNHDYKVLANKFLVALS